MKLHLLSWSVHRDDQMMTRLCIWQEHIDLDATALAEAVRPLLQPDQNVMVSFEFKRLTEVPHIAVGLAKVRTI